MVLVTFAFLMIGKGQFELRALRIEHGNISAVAVRGGIVNTIHTNKRAAVYSRNDTND